MTPEELKSKVDQVLQWPRLTRSDEENCLLRERRVALHSQIYALVDNAERFDRNLTAEEAERYAELQDEYDRLGNELPSL